LLVSRSFNFIQREFLKLVARARREIYRGARGHFTAEELVEAFAKLPKVTEEEARLMGAAAVKILGPANMVLFNHNYLLAMAAYF
jgi:hypothetical protein